jgi:hypothetical protein
MKMPIDTSPLSTRIPSSSSNDLGNGRQLNLARNKAVAPPSLKDALSFWTDPSANENEVVLRASGLAMAKGVPCLAIHGFKSKYFSAEDVVRMIDEYDRTLPANRKLGLRGSGIENNSGIDKSPRTLRITIRFPPGTKAADAQKRIDDFGNRIALELERRNLSQILAAQEVDVSPQQSKVVIYVVTPPAGMQVSHEYGAATTFGGKVVNRRR